MPTVARPLDRRAALADVRRQSEALANKRGEAAKKKLGGLYELTIEGWGNSDDNPKPIFKIEYKVTFTGKGHRIEITAEVESKVWNWLDEGTKTIIQPKTSPEIKERKGRRYEPDKLKPKAFGGFTGRTFRIRKGKRRRGIKANRLTRSIGRRFRQDWKYKDFRVIRVSARGKQV